MLRWAVSLTYLSAQLYKRVGDLNESLRLLQQVVEAPVERFNPTLGTKVVDAAYEAGIIAAGTGEVSQARAFWHRGVERAWQLLASPVEEFVGDLEHPHEFPSVVAVEFLDSAVRCIKALRWTSGRYARPTQGLYLASYANWKAMLADRSAAIADMELMIGERDKIIGSQAGILEKRWETIRSQEAMIADRDQVIVAQGRMLEERWQIMQSEEAMIADRDQVIAAQGRMLEERWEILQSQGAMIAAQKRMLDLAAAYARRRPAWRRLIRRIQSLLYRTGKAFRQIASGGRS